MYKITAGVSCALYTVFFGVTYVLSNRFGENHSFLDVATYSAAKEAYSVIELFSTLECITFISLIAIIAIGFRKFILKHTGTSVGSDGYTVSSAKYHSSLIKKSLGLFGTMALLVLLKCINVHMLGDPEIVYSDTGTIVTTAIPWFGTVIFAVSVLLVFYSFIYLGELKNELRIKYEIQTLK